MAVQRPVRLWVGDFALRRQPHAGGDVLDDFGWDLVDRDEVVQVLEALELHHQGQALSDATCGLVDPLQLLRRRAEEAL